MTSPERQILSYHLVSCQSRRPAGSAYRQRRGVTVLEMAIITPLVLMLILAIIDLSIAVYSYVNIAEAARAGARYAAVHGASATVKCGPTSNDAKVESLVRSYNAGLVSSRLTVNSTWPQGNNSPGSRVTVSINYEYPLVTTWFLGRASIKLSASQSMIIIH